MILKETVNFIRPEEYITEMATNISIQFFDEYDKEEDSITKMVTYKQGNKKKTFELDDMEKNIPKEVLKIMKEKFFKKTGMSSDNISDFAKQAGKVFKYKDGDYDISMTVSDNKENKVNGTFRIDQNEIKKSREGVKSQAEKAQEIVNKGKSKVDIKGIADDIKKEKAKKEFEKQKKEKEKVATKEVNKAEKRTKGTWGTSRIFSS